MRKVLKLCTGLLLPITILSIAGCGNKEKYPGPLSPGEALKSLQEDVLRHVFRLGGIREQSERSCVHHILVPSHERLELPGVRHRGKVIRRQPRS